MLKRVDFTDKKKQKSFNAQVLSCFPSSLDINGMVKVPSEEHESIVKQIEKVKNQINHLKSSVSYLLNLEVNKISYYRDMLLNPI